MTFSVKRMARFAGGTISVSAFSSRFMMASCRAGDTRRARCLVVSVSDGGVLGRWGGGLELVPPHGIGHCLATLCSDGRSAVPRLQLWPRLQLKGQGATANARPTRQLRFSSTRSACRRPPVRQGSRLGHYTRDPTQRQSRKMRMARPRRGPHHRRYDAEDAAHGGDAIGGLAARGGSARVSSKGARESMTWAGPGAAVPRSSSERRPTDSHPGASSEGSEGDSSSARGS